MAPYNIGDRQYGRLCAASIINCNDETQSIVNAIEKALSPSFIEICKETKSVYGNGETAVKIKNYLKETSLDCILKKKFYDLKNIS